MGEVINANIRTTLDTDPDRMLQSAIGKLKRVVIIGVEHDDTEWFASSAADGGSVLWDMARARHKLMLIADEEED